jgi:STE24 endopeptidase
MSKAGRGLWRRLATLVVLAAGWFVAASFLWRSRVPSGLQAPHLDPHRYFTPHELAHIAGYDRFLTIDGALGSLALLVALGLYAWKGTAFVKESAAGRIGTGMLLGMLAFGIVWLAQLPFRLAGLWWERRHHTASQDYVSYVIANWLGLGVTFLFICVTIVIVMGLASLLGRRWWIVGAPAFVGIAILFAFTQPYLLVKGSHRLRDPALRADVQRLERAEGVSGVPVRVLVVHGDTKQVNAFTTGLGSSRRVFIYDTFLRGGFGRNELRVVLAHEIGHQARDHIWKGLAWYALFAIPGAYLVTRATRRRGGLTEPEAIPLALFVLTLLQFVALPVQNVISRRMESEADWMALQTTRDPAAARSLFEKFARIDLAEPRPPTWDYVLFEDHPTIIQRIAMAEAWKARVRTRAATRTRAGSGSPRGSTTSTTSPASRRSAPS